MEARMRMAADTLQTVLTAHLSKIDLLVLKVFASITVLHLLLVVCWVLARTAKHIVAEAKDIWRYLMEP
jgi:hypothetical protein